MQIKARVIKNSRNEDAIEVIVDKKYVSSAPSGASTGKHEVKSFVKDIKYSVDYINKKLNLQGIKFEEFNDLEIFDSLISEIGGNPVVALQGAILKKMSDNNVHSFLSNKKKFPIPLGNCIGGGAHTKYISTDIQEFLLISFEKSFVDRVKLSRHIYDYIGKVTKAKKKTDEGAFVLGKTDTEVLDFLCGVVDKYKDEGYKIEFGLDIAATQFYKNKKYIYNNFSPCSKKEVLSKAEQIMFVNEMIKDYDLSYVEDPLNEEDFYGFSKISKKTLVCGDDLITTSIDRLKKGLKSVNCIIVKPNQIGSLIKTKEIIEFAHKNDIKTVISHRSGETLDPLIAHLAVGFGTEYIKTGIFGKEREVKLNELVKIEKTLA